MSCQEKNMRKVHKIFTPAPVLGWHLCFCLLLASLLQKPLAWASFCSWPWISFCTPPTVLRQCPGLLNISRPLEIFSKRGPKVWWRDSIFRCRQSLWCRWTKLKQPEVYLGKKPTLTVTRISFLSVWGVLLWATLRREAVSLAVKKFVNQRNGRTKKTSLCSSYLCSKVSDG